MSSELLDWPMVLKLVILGGFYTVFSVVFLWGIREIVAANKPSKTEHIEADGADAIKALFEAKLEESSAIRRR